MPLLTKFGLPSVSAARTYFAPPLLLTRQIDPVQNHTKPEPSGRDFDEPQQFLSGPVSWAPQTFSPWLKALTVSGWFRGICSLALMSAIVRRTSPVCLHRQTNASQLTAPSSPNVNNAKTTPRARTRPSSPSCLRQRCRFVGFLPLSLAAGWERFAANPLV